MSSFGIFGNGSSGNGWFTQRLNDFHDSTKKYDPITHYTVEGPMKGAHWLVEKGSKNVADMGIAPNFMNRLSQEADENGNDFGLGSQRLGIGTLTTIAAMYGGGYFGGGASGAGSAGGAAGGGATTGGFASGESLGVLAGDAGGGLGGASLGGAGGATTGGFGSGESLGVLASDAGGGAGAGSGFAGDGMLTSYQDPYTMGSGSGIDPNYGEVDFGDQAFDFGQGSGGGSWYEKLLNGAGSMGGNQSGGSGSPGASGGASAQASAPMSPYWQKDANGGNPALSEALARLVSEQEQTKRQQSNPFLAAMNYQSQPLQPQQQTPQQSRFQRAMSIYDNGDPYGRRTT